MPQPITLWLVEDERRFREPFERLLATAPDFDLARSYDRYEALAADLDLGASPPDLVVMDLHLPGADGTQGTLDLARRCPGLPVVVLTSSDDPPSVFRALAAGAMGYVVKGDEPERMFTALREAHAGGTSFSPSVARHVLGRFMRPAAPAEPLSARETDVLRELADGRSKAGIAEVLYLSPHTVDSHLRSVYQKLHAGNAAEAVARGVRLGVI